MAVSTRTTSAGLAVVQTRTTAASAVAVRTAGVATRTTAASAYTTSQITTRTTSASAVATAAPSVTVPVLVDLEPGVPVTVLPLVEGVDASSITWACNVPGVAMVQDPVTGLLRYKPPATRNGVTLTWTATVVHAGGTLTASAQHVVLPHGGWWTAKADGSGLYPVLVGVTL